MLKCIILMFVLLYIKKKNKLFYIYFLTIWLISAIFIWIFVLTTHNILLVSFTKYYNSLGRNVIGTSVPLVVWTCSLVFGWEKFSFLQLFGFAINNFGVLCYY
jgi:hypothetical protein